MTLLRVSPWYQEAFDKGVEWGIKQGELRAAKRIVRLILQERFGALPTIVTARLDTITLDQSDDLVRHALRAPSLDDFLAHLPAPAAPTE